MVDSTDNQLYTRLHISPVQSGFAYSGSIITADAVVARQEDAPVPVPLVPNSYVVQCFGRNTQSTFNMTLPTSSDGTTQSAINFITTQSCYP